MEESEFVSKLKAFGWRFEDNPDGLLFLPDEVKNRYLSIPKQIETFLGNYKIAVNSEQNEWFICSDDFERDEDGTFHWNEFERISLKVADDEGDDEFKNRVLEFWDRHFPFYMGVEGEYRFAAIVVKGEDKGKIVFGYEPMFGEASIVADGLESYFDVFIEEKEDELEDEDEID